MMTTRLLGGICLLVLGCGDTVVSDAGFSGPTQRTKVRLGDEELSFESPAIVERQPNGRVGLRIEAGNPKYSLLIKAYLGAAEIRAKKLRHDLAQVEVLLLEGADPTAVDSWVRVAQGVLEIAFKGNRITGTLTALQPPLEAAIDAEVAVACKNDTECDELSPLAH